jgi:hypothetical protein
MAVHIAVGGATKNRPRVLTGVAERRQHKYDAVRQNNGEAKVCGGEACLPDSVAVVETLPRVHEVKMGTRESVDAGVAVLGAVDSFVRRVRVLRCWWLGAVLRTDGVLGLCAAHRRADHA